MLSIKGPTAKEILEIQDNKLLVLIGATWDDYWSLANEDLKVEYIEDRIYIHSPADIDHEEIFGNLLTEIKNLLNKNNFGKVLGSRFPIETHEGKRIEPDILFLSNSVIEKGNLSKTFFKGNPTWIIEIISPKYREHDTVTKREIYRLINVAEYWIIDPVFKTLEIIKFKNKKEVYKSIIESGKVKPNLDGFQEFYIDLDKIWLLLF